MTKVFLDTDADLGQLKGRMVAAIGYGNQVRAQALNMHDLSVEHVVESSMLGHETKEGVVGGPERRSGPIEGTQHAPPRAHSGCGYHHGGSRRAGTSAREVRLLACGVWRGRRLESFWGGDAARFGIDNSAPVKGCCGGWGRERR